MTSLVRPATAAPNKPRPKQIGKPASTPAADTPPVGLGYRSILVHVHADAEMQVRCAAALADRFGAELIGVGCEMIPPEISDVSVISEGMILSGAIGDLSVRLADAKRLFDRLAGHREKRWVTAYEPPDDYLARCARSADLIVTSAGRSPDPLRREDAGHLVIIAGRPVLVAPIDQEDISIDRVQVCWKDCREARRALTDSLPLLRLAKEVLVVEVAEPDALAEACARTREIADYLKRCGVAATGEVTVKDERPTAVILRDRADCFAADLIVAGAYGHSRFGEWVMGGVTRALLSQSSRPVLLSH